MLISKLFGGRVIKTGISVFITAFLCELFNFPVIFAVITAIVTIEPSSHESIQKGMIRFPAAAIGAAYAMTLEYVFGNHPITYALSAVLTIVTCHKLKLEAGLLVATLTAVNMIPVTYDHYLESFFIRLVTTMIGLTVSTIVNIFILPPNYSKTIKESLDDLQRSLSLFLEQWADVLRSKETKRLLEDFHRIMEHLEKAEKQCLFQREEWKYHSFNKSEVRQFHFTHKKLAIFRQILFHAGNLSYSSMNIKNLSTEQIKMIGLFVHSLSKLFVSAEETIDKEHYDLLRELQNVLKTPHASMMEEDCTSIAKWPQQDYLIYELIAIHDLTMELIRISEKEQKHIHHPS